LKGLVGPSRECPIESGSPDEAGLRIRKPRPKVAKAGEGTIRSAPQSEEMTEKKGFGRGGDLRVWTGTLWPATQTRESRGKYGKVDKSFIPVRT